MPPYFNWRSWQLWLCYIIALLNALVAALLTLYTMDGHSLRWVLTITLGIITALLQIGLGVAYLKSREG